MILRFDKAVSGLFMHWQPIVRWSDRSTFAYEALVRSSEPTIPSPDALFDAGDRLGRTAAIGQRVRSLCGETIRDAVVEKLFFVNVHPQDLVDDTFCKTAGPLARFAERIVLEITERARLETIPNVADRIGRLRSLGYRIAIDDIGAGYAGLTSFAALEPEFMKLDGTLVRDIDRSKTKLSLVWAMTKACADLGVQVIGEGVETTAERDALLGLGCDLLQGFLFARPGRPFVTPLL